MNRFSSYFLAELFIIFSIIYELFLVWSEVFILLILEWFNLNALALLLAGFLLLLFSLKFFFIVVY